jgi:hypothetical protein
MGLRLPPPTPAREPATRLPLWRRGWEGEPPLRAGVQDTR